MTQNIYDDPEFLAAYSRLGRSVDGLDGAAEWPALRALLPELCGRNLVDLGCGFGWFCRWARDQGAAEVLGIDVSEKMLARARAATTDPAISYLQADLDAIELPERSFDLAYSSLALHYIEDLERLLATVYRALVLGGRLVFSVEHPIYTAPLLPRWTVAADGRKQWPVDSYLCEGPRRPEWLGKRVGKQHRTLGTYVNSLLRLGFALSHVEDWGPTDAQIATRPELAEERERPMFLLIAARR